VVSVRIYPNQVPHSIVRDARRDLVGGVAVGVNKKPAMALPDMVNEEIYMKRGLADASECSSNGNYDRTAGSLALHSFASV
jgi:hypothetical protein